MKLKHCEIFFYFGIFNDQDIDSLSYLLKYLNGKLNTFPALESSFNSYTWKQILNVYTKILLKERVNGNVNQKFEIDRSKDSIEHYKSVLNSFNFNYANDIINIIKDESLVWNEIHRAVDYMIKIQLYNHGKLKKQAKILAFLMNQTYLNSELFQKHWNEAKSLNKEIIFLNEDLYPSQLGEFHVKIFKLCRSESELEYNRELTF